MKKRLLSLLLAALIVALPACAGGNDTPAETTAAPGAETTAAPVADETTAPLFTPDDLPAKMDFGNSDVTILSWKPYVDEFNTKGYTGDIISDALYERITRTEERLGIKLNFVFEKGDYSARKDFVSYAAKSINASEGAYDLVAHYSLAASLGAMQNLYQNLLEVPNLNLEKPWWPGDIVEATKIGGKVYFATGDIAPTVLYNIFGIFFNRTILEANHFEDPYKLVKEGKWTFDRLSEMSIGLYADVNNNQVADEGDRFGFAFRNANNIDPFFYAAGLTIVDKNSDGDFILSESFIGEKAATWLDTLCAFLHNNNDVILLSGESPTFPSGQALFYGGHLEYAIQSLRDVEFGYGVVPLPKYDAAQERYYSIVGMPYSMYTIPVDTKDPARAGALLEALASDAYRNASPAIFETAFKIKYAESAETGEMYDLIRDSLVYDVGRTFGDSISSAFSLFRGAVRDNNPNWASLIASKKGTYESKIEQIVDKLG